MPPSTAPPAGQPYPGDYTAPYAVSAGGIDLVEVDTSAACDNQQQFVALYRQQFGQAATLAGQGAWLVTHRPLLAYQNTGSAKTGSLDDNGCRSTFAGLSAWKNLTVQAAASGPRRLVRPDPLRPRPRLPGGLRAGIPPQLVTGNGGTSITGGLEKNPAPPAIGPQGLPAPTYAGTRAQPGFALLSRTSTGWSASVVDRHGKTIATCPIAAGALTCS